MEEGKTPSSVTGLTGFVMGGLGEVTSWDVVMADSRVSERSITPPPWGPESGTFFVHNHLLIAFSMWQSREDAVRGSRRGAHFLGTH